jgi:hypothetical protein
MRPQHEVSEHFVPRSRNGNATSFVGRIRQERPKGKPGQHRLASARAHKAAAAALPITRSPLGVSSGEAALVPAPVAPVRYVEPDDMTVLDGTVLDGTVLDGEVVDLQAPVERFLTPAGPLTPGLGPVRALRGPVKVGRFVALGLMALLGVGAVMAQPGSSSPAMRLDSASAQALLADRSSSAADRSQQRTANPSPIASVAVNATKAAAANPAATATPKPKPQVTKPAKPAPVAGLNQAQMTNAQTIVQTGQKLGIPQRGLLVALMTAMQESNLYNLASQAVPDSFNYPHQGQGMDYDSCGLFQQRTSMGWGTVAQIMDPIYSSTKFYKSLVGVGGWQSMELTLAAQAVQGSAFPYAYAKHESRARTILNALT